MAANPSSNHRHSHRANASATPRILVVDDSPAAILEFRTHLGVAFDLTEALDCGLAVKFAHDALDTGQPFALAFVEVRTGLTWDGLETITRLWKIDATLQVVVCASAADYSWPQITAKLGVNENFLILQKPFAQMEVLQLAHTLTRKWQMAREAHERLAILNRRVATRAAELETSHAQLLTSEERFARAFRSSPTPQAIQTIIGQRFVEVNDAFLALTGFPRRELIGRTPLELRLCIDYDPRLRQRAIEGEPIREVAGQISTHDGRLLDALISIERIIFSNEPHTLLMVQDISERLNLENQLRQAQKMEAIGQLAAGVAHDFNNMLTIIQGHASLQLAAVGLSKDTKESLEQITLAAERAANLTRQLLAFSRRQILQPRVLVLNELLRDLTTMLRRLIGENIELKCAFDEGLPPVWADSTGLEQVLMNLTLNARDAMPRGGRITISTETVTVRATEAECAAGKRSGKHVVFRVRDTGSGMNAETRAHIFEPFFTTKDVNKGTGMGLATVYGIVLQHEGWIDVETAPGAGSTFSVFLPVTDRVAEQPIAEPFDFEFTNSQHTVLVVEDDRAVRAMVRDVLVDQGYSVLEAEDAQDALEVSRAHRDEIELLLTDVVMPGEMDGLELARILCEENPALKIVYTTGYSSELFSGDMQIEEGVNYLPKPYPAMRLLSIVRRAFDSAEDLVEH
jgi:PAS domain S-box-containing protein